jgi:Zn-dependent M28 family amino/carboxypeptidase
MRNLLIAAATAGLIVASPAGAADLATAQALRDKALSDPTAWAVLESLTTEIGGRPTGSAAMTRARDWSVATFKALGFTNVRVEAFEAPSWLRGEESAEVLSPYPQKLHILGLGLSAPTPKGGIEAEIVVFRTLADLKDQAPGSLKGKIAVVTQPMSRTQDGSGYGGINAARTAGAAEASKRGAVAYLVRSLSTDDTRLPHTGGMRPWGDVAPIPAAALSTPDADLLENMAARGKPVKVRLSMASTFNPKAPAWNISGEIKGREAPDEVVVLGGHLDSWDPGTGAVDDGAGIAIAVAAAKVVASLPNGPRRTIRIVMWGAEEQGGSSDAYLAAHKDELPKIVLVGESDEGAGRIWRASLPLNSAGHPAMQTFLRAVTPLKVNLDRAPATDGGADISQLVEAGAPVVSLRQDASRYFDLHHSADDTLDKVGKDELAQNVAVWTSLLYSVADSDIDFRQLAGPAK